MTIYVNARAIIEREIDTGLEILLQVRARSGEPERWELPGGQIDQFEPVLDALAREIQEETGLALTLVQEQAGFRRHDGESTTVETFEPFFAYQTLDGPVDSLGFYFRCQVEGEIAQTGDDARQPTWFTLDDLARTISDAPDQFDWLTQAALQRYLEWCREQ